MVPTTSNPLSLIIFVVARALGFVANGDDTDVARKLIRHFDGRKIDFIKEIRRATGLGLRDAKEAMEEIIRLYSPRTADVSLTQDQIEVLMTLLGPIYPNEADPNAVHGAYSALEAARDHTGQRVEKRGDRLYRIY